MSQRRPAERPCKGSPGTLTILADLSARSGLGHVRRCAAIAEELASSGWQVYWLFDPAAAALAGTLDLPGQTSLWQAGGQCAGSASASAAASKDGAAAARTCLPIADGVRLMDGYHFSADLLAVMASRPGYLVLLDDGELPGPLHADIVIRPVEPLPGEDFSSRVCGRYLQGVRWQPVAASFREASTRLPARRARWLISFGGSDPLGLTAAFLDALDATALPVDQVGIDLVIGGACQEAESLCARAIRLGATRAPGQTAAAASAVSPVSPVAAPRDWRIYVDHKDMAGLMQTAGCALAAAGSTALELALMQVPAWLLVVAENQRRAAEWVQAAGYGHWVEARQPIDWEGLIAACLEQLRKAGQGVQPEPAACQAAAFDGRGAERIADEIAGLLEADLQGHCARKQPGGTH